MLRYPLAVPNYCVLLLLCGTYWIPQSCAGVDVSLTLNIPAGIRECLHQALVAGVEYEVEYQVIDGGELDVNFVVSSPSYQVLLTDIRKTGNVHKRIASETGDHEFCIDNSFSHYSFKVVYFELITYDDNEEDDQEDFFGSLPDDTDYDVKLDDFKESMDKIRDQLQKCVQTQRTFSAIESRDRSLLEGNFERVNFWSGVNLSVMITASIINVILIRRLFSDTRPARMATKERT